MEIALVIMIVSVVVFLSALAYSTAKLVQFGCVSPEKKHLTEEKMLEVRKKQMPDYAGVFEKGYEYLASLPVENVEIRSRDGLMLRGELFANPAGRGTVIMFHGFRSSPHADMSPVCEFYYSLGFSMLLPAQRAHCASEGKYLTYGAKERYDCADWADFISEKSGKDSPIVLDGISMGAATVLASVSAGLPENVKCIIADCGFTSPKDVFRHVMKTMMHLPKFPLYYLFAMGCRLFCGFSIKEPDVTEIMKSCSVPVLFVHGEADTLVPCDMSRRNYDACAAEKRIVTVPGANHGESYLKDKAGCDKALREFIDSYV